MSLEDQTTLDPSATYDGDETLPAGVGEPPAQEAYEPKQLDRFRLERLLGQGGMGQVWEAWDPQLERPVAIKRLLRADPSARRRFVREARLQATLAHPGICPVFEVGQDAGEPYLVMPRLDGVRLDEAVEGEPLEYKLDLMRQVADAIHAAHQQGLIHRDLKPANILVEHPTDAPPRPVVLDFGIARPVGGEMLTAPGEVVGTPAYMAPEQIEGASVQLDRRTDVYALGATLYRLLCGRPPHGGTGTPLLLSIVHEEPERLPSGDIPAEVEAIVFKCLEKDKNRRYDSARALAEDLERYLAGEPVHARPVTRWIRLGKWARRHRVAVRVTSAAAMLAIAGLTWGGWSAWRSGERQEAARQFGAQVEEIEALARYSHLVPLHDVREDRKLLRSRLDAIRPSLEDRDPVIRALASHAMGRGHLALDELEKAREYLEAAYELDPENSEIAVDLGRTLSEIYRERLIRMERARDFTRREAVREKLSSSLKATFHNTSEQQKQWQRTLKGPALELLAAGRYSGSLDDVELDALILFHEGQPEAALDLLVTVSSAPAWDYERLHLEGDIRRSWAVDLASDPEKNAESKQQLEKARETYSRALEVAQSSSALLRADAQATALLIHLDLVSSEDVAPLIEEARRRLVEARKINPEDLQNWLWTTRLELSAAAYRFELGRNPAPFLAKALSASKQALELDSESSIAWLGLAQVHEKLARWQRFKGEDPTASFERAAQAFDRVSQADRDYSYYTQVGHLQITRAAQQAERGLKAADAYRTAMDTYRSAAKIHSSPYTALANLGIAFFEAAGVEGMGAEAMLQQSIEIFEQAQELRPNQMEVSYYLGLCRTRLAQGADLNKTIVDEAMAEMAQVDFKRAIELAPESFQPWVAIGELFHLQAITAYSRGLDPDPFFFRAREAHGNALELAPEQPIALLNMAWTAYFEGKYALRGGLDPAHELAEAEELCRRSLRGRRYPKALLCLGSVQRLQAENHLSQGELEIATPRMTEAKRLFEEILGLNPTYAEAHRSLGRLLTLEAQRLRQKGEDPSSALAEARGFLDRALELESPAHDFYLADARWHLERARWLRSTHQADTEDIQAGQLSLTAIQERAGESVELSRLQADFNFFKSHFFTSLKEEDQ